MSKPTTKVRTKSGALPAFMSSDENKGKSNIKLEDLDWFGINDELDPDQERKKIPHSRLALQSLVHQIVCAHPQAGKDAYDRTKKVLNLLLGETPKRNRPEKGSDREILSWIADQFFADFYNGEARKRSKAKLTTEALEKFNPKYSDMLPGGKQSEQVRILGKFKNELNTLLSVTSFNDASQQRRKKLENAVKAIRALGVGINELN